MLRLVKHLSPPRRPANHLLPPPAAAAAAVWKPTPPPPLLTLLRPLSSSSTTPSPPLLSFLRGGCHDDSSPSPALHLPLCPGCGVHMQDTTPSLPGFFTTPSVKPPDYRAPLDRSCPLPVSATYLKSGFLPSPTSTSASASSPPKPLVCARCHSLRHYGRVKDPSTENLLPNFDFDRMVAPKMLSPSGPRSVLLLIADAADFDGSFPRSVARLASAAADRHALAWKEGKPSNVPRAVLVVTKIDLLPSSLDPDAVESWVRQRAHFAGAGNLAGVHMVSAVRDWGVLDLLEHARQLAGPRGNVWTVGAQNAGKSTLINAMGRCAGEKMSHLTEAPVPGTTLGIVRVDGVIGGQAKLFDTPGILHPHQITMRLTREEQKLVHMSKELKPRTYRIKAGYSVHIGGLMRVDVEESSVESIYLTVWASPLLPLHMGKAVNASAMIEDHFGRQLQPPIGEKRVSELGKWVRREFSVSGNSWDASSVDIAAAGLGWVAIGLKGDALLGVWTYDGIDLVSRSSLIPKRARIFEETGFTVSKIVSQADSALNKQKHKADKKQHNCRLELPGSPSPMPDTDMIA